MALATKRARADKKTANFAAAAECLRVLAHPQRLRIVDLLLDRRYSVGQLAELLEIPSHLASTHLRLMQRCGMLGSVRAGRVVYYCVADGCLTEFMACIRKRFAPTMG